MISASTRLMASAPRMKSRTFVLTWSSVRGRRLPKDLSLSRLVSCRHGKDLGSHRCHLRSKLGIVQNDCHDVSAKGRTGLTEEFRLRVNIEACAVCGQTGLEGRCDIPGKIPALSRRAKEDDLGFVLPDEG